MRGMLAACALAVFSLAPAICLACDGMDASSASVRTPDKVATAQTSTASKAAVPAVTKARSPDATKPAVVKVKTAPAQKLAASTMN